MKLEISKYKGEWFIFTGLAFIIIATVAKSYLPNYSINYGTLTLEIWRKYVAQRQTLPFVLLNILEGFGTLMFVISLIFTGIRLVRKKLFKTRAVSFIIVGLSVCIYNLCTTYIGKNFNYDIPKPNPEILKHNIDSHNYNLKVKSKLSKMYAEQKYTYYGIIVEYITETGENTVYKPSNKDLEFRDLDVLAKEIWDDNKKRLPISFNYWLAVTIASCLLGMLTPIKRHPTTGSTGAKPPRDP